MSADLLNIRGRIAALKPPHYVADYDGNTCSPNEGYRDAIKAVLTIIDVAQPMSAHPKRESADFTMAGVEADALDLMKRAAGKGGMKLDRWVSFHLRRVAEEALAKPKRKGGVAEGASWSGDPARTSAELRRIANMWQPGFRLPQLLRDAADEIDCLSEALAAAPPPPASAPGGVAGLSALVARAIADPGATEGYKGDRSLTEWQTAAVIRALATPPPHAESEGEADRG